MSLHLNNLGVWPAFVNHTEHLSIHVVTPNKFWSFSKNCPVGKPGIRCEARYNRFEIGTGLTRAWDMSGTQLKDRIVTYCFIYKKFRFQGRFKSSPRHQKSNPLLFRPSNTIKSRGLALGGTKSRPSRHRAFPRRYRHILFATDLSEAAQQSPIQAREIRPAMRCKADRAARHGTNAHRWRRARSRYHSLPDGIRTTAHRQCGAAFAEDGTAAGLLPYHHQTPERLAGGYHRFLRRRA